MTVEACPEAAGGFDDLPAGPALAAVLEAVDGESLVGEAAASWMRAAFRVRNHADWLLLVSLREACRARAGTTVRVELDEFSPKIAAASLGWTTTMAAARLHLAQGVLERMPALGEAMQAGTLDAAEASAFVTGLDGLSDEQARRVVDAVLPDVRSMGLSQLRERILDAAYAVDPVWAAARLAAATARARVSAETAPSGAVDLCGRDLDPNLAEHARARLRTLALAIRTRLRASGHPMTLGFIEARVFIRLMDGTQAGAGDDATVIDAVTLELSTPGNRRDDQAGDDGDGDGDGDDDGDGDGDDDDDGDDGDDDDDGDDGDDDGDDGDDGDAGPHDPGDPDGDGGGPGPDGDRGPETPNSPGGHGPSDHERAESEPAPEDLLPEEPRDASDSPLPVSPCVVFTPAVAVRLALSTLLGLDDQPGLLPGVGPVPAETARAAARARGAAAWRLLLHDQPGHLQHVLALRAPPSATDDVRFTRQTVQLTAPAALLHALGPSAAAGAETLASARPVLLGGAMTAWIARARDALVRAETADLDAHPATTTRERDRRFPGTRLAEYIRARDQTCIFPTCTRPADACDLDHTVDWLDRGRTEAGNLAALCRHEHRAKHEGGWSYDQPAPGRFAITDPTGTRHHVHSRVIHPRPAPLAPGLGITAGSPRATVERPDWTPRRTREGRLTPEARDTAEHLMTRSRAQHHPPSRYDHDPDF